MTFLGRPVAHWLFGLRTWFAMVLALYVAFWLQLDGASRAATGVAILALPTRGQASDKALWRLAGTAIGVAAAFVIAGLFNETRTLFVAAVASWLALCVFVGGSIDENRAYAAVLGGYTVAIVAVANIDTPQRTFSSGLGGAAAIAVAVLAVGLVNDVLGAPNVLPTLVTRIEACHAEVRAFALRALDGKLPDVMDVAALFGRITALRADALLLPAESAAGGARAGAARRAIAELVREARAARILGATITDAESARHIELVGAFEDALAADRLLGDVARAMAADATPPQDLIMLRSVEALVERDRAVTDAVRDMASGQSTIPAPTLPIHRSRRAAARTAVSLLITILVVMSLLVAGGWPASVSALVNLCILAGLSATNPNPWGFAIGAAIALPLAVASVGVTEFLILDGVDSYPLLAIALMPTVLAGCLLVASGRPKLFGVGFLLNVYTPALLSPANPQLYDPQSYLSSSLFDLLAAGLLVVGIAVVLPTDDLRRRGWMLAAAHRDLLAAIGIRPDDRLTREDASYRAADRLGRLVGLRYRDDAERDAVLTHALHLAEVTFSAHGVRDALVGVRTAIAEEALDALRALDATRLHAAGTRLCALQDGRWAGANAARTAVLIERYATDLIRAEFAA